MGAVIRAHGLYRREDLAIQVNELANPEAGKIALRGAPRISEREAS
jgi:hypothetical protein